MYLRSAVLVIRSAAALLVLFGTAPYAQGKDVRDAWNRVLKKCARNQTMGKNGIFFGPSNSVGPGSVWRQTDDKGYGLRFELSDAFPDENTRKKLVVEGNPVECAGNTSSSWDIKAGLPFESRIKPLSGDISAGFHRAKKIQVKVNSFAWQLVKELPYEQAFKSLDENSPYKKDLSAPNRWVIGKALLVNGFVAELDFDSSVGLSLKSQIPSGELKSADNTRFALAWKGDTHLTITSNESFYIWGQKSRMVRDSLGLAGGAPTEYKMVMDDKTVQHPEQVKDERPR